MRGAARWLTVLTTVAATAGVVAGCGGGDTSVSVPSAPGAALTDRVLTAAELGIPGYTASREPVVAQTAEDFLAGDCPAERDASLAVIKQSGFQAAARRAFTADNGGGLSAVWQFATPAGATRWTRANLAQTGKAYPGCVPKGVRQTSYAVRPVAGLPEGRLTHATQTGPDGPSEAWNVLYTDGRFAYVVGTAGAPGRVSSAQVTDAARRQWQRRNG